MPEEELNNLARIGQLEKVPYSKQLTQKMLATADTRLQDAQRTQNSAETRFIRTVSGAEADGTGGCHQSIAPGDMISQ